MKKFELTRHTTGPMTLDGAYQGFHVATHDPGIAVITFNEPDRLNGISRGMNAISPRS